jgi:glucosamine-6-phosphate deaminase
MIKMITSNLKVNIYETRAQMGKSAAEAVSGKIRELLTNKEEVNVVFAAAPSQNEFLASLVQQDLDWGSINAFHMDEYIGLDENAPQAFGNFLEERLFSKRPFNRVNYLKDLSYAQLLEQYPVDIVCMGIGENGHIAFNDPPVADFNDPETVKVVELDAACRQQQVNDGCFASIAEVPTHALTLTVPALLAAPNIFCIVPGPAKAQAVFNTLNMPVETAYPSTILRNHENAVLFLDRDSSALVVNGGR